MALPQIEKASYNKFSSLYLFNHLLFRMTILEKTMFHHRCRKFLFLCLLVFSFSAFVPAQNTDASLLTIDRIFNSGEFGAQGVGGFRWLKSGNAYTKIEPSATVKGGTDLVSYDVEKNTRNVLISAEKLIPTGETAPLRISGYEWSADNGDRKSVV